MIGALLPMLRQRRMARRDAAHARLARIQAQVEALQAEVRRCDGQLREAQAALQAVRQGQGQAADPLWRQALLPSCEGVVERERAACTRALAAVEPALGQLAEARKALLQQERAMLRTQELEQLQRAADRQAEASTEQSVDEDLAAAWRPGGRTAMAPACGEGRGRP
jgi:chromosome segregation ATPase